MASLAGTDSGGGVYRGQPAGDRYRIPESARVERLETLDLPVSSSEIRAELASGKRQEEIPEAVLEYIYRNGLYGVPVGA